MDSRKLGHAGHGIRSGIRAGACNGEPLEYHLDQFVDSFKHWAVFTCDSVTPKCEGYLEIYLDKFRQAVFKSWGK